jgi:hypothetical protein
MNIDKLSYPEAIERIARKRGVEIICDTVDGESIPEERKHGNALKDRYEGAAKSYHAILKEKHPGKRHGTILRNEGFVNLGFWYDTAEFAVESILRWRQQGVKRQTLEEPTTGIRE